MSPTLRQSCNRSLFITVVSKYKHKLGMRTKRPSCPCCRCFHPSREKNALLEKFAWRISKFAPFLDARRAFQKSFFFFFNCCFILVAGQSWDYSSRWSIWINSFLKHPQFPEERNKMSLKFTKELVLQTSSLRLGETGKHEGREGRKTSFDWQSTSQNCQRIEPGMFIKFCLYKTFRCGKICDALIERSF